MLYRLDTNIFIQAKNLRCEKREDSKRLYRRESEMHDAVRNAPPRASTVCTWEVIRQEMVATRLM